MVAEVVVTSPVTSAVDVENLYPTAGGCEYCLQNPVDTCKASADTWRCDDIGMYLSVEG